MTKKRTLNSGHAWCMYLSYIPIHQLHMHDKGKNTAAYPFICITVSRQTYTDREYRISDISVTICYKLQMTWCFLYILLENNIFVVFIIPVLHAYIVSLLLFSTFLIMGTLGEQERGKGNGKWQKLDKEWRQTF